MERGGVLKSFVADCLYVENGKHVFLHGGEQEFPFWIREFKYPSAFSVARRCCTGIGIGCCGVVGRWATGLFMTNGLVFCQCMNITRFYATGCVCKPFFGWLTFFHYSGLLFSLNSFTRLLIIIFLFLLCLCFYKVDVRLL